MMEFFREAWAKDIDGASGSMAEMACGRRQPPPCDMHIERHPAPAQDASASEEASGRAYGISGQDKTALQMQFVTEVLPFVS